jgi:hypothetical protein
LTIRRINGYLNQTFPLWELGACLYWRSFDPLHVQTPGGLGDVTYNYQVSAWHPYYYYDPGKGQFFQAASPIFPPDGFIPAQRTNYWNNSQDADRGFSDMDSLSLGYPSISMWAHYILDPSSAGLVTTFQATNIGATVGRIYSEDTTSLTESRNFQVLLHRPGGGVINSSVASIWIAWRDIDGEGDPPVPIFTAHEGTPTTYRKIREDGWYVLDSSIPPKAAIPPAITAPNYYYGVLIQPGYTVDVEMPTLEGYGASTPIGSFAAPHLGVSNSVRGVHALTIQRQDDAGLGIEGWHREGWMASLIVDPYPASTARAAGTALNHENSAMANTDYFRMSMSATYQQFVALLYEGGASEMYLNTTHTVQGPGSVSALVHSWGRRQGVKRTYLFENGRPADLETVYSIPTAVARPNYYQLGFRNVSSTVLSHCLQSVAIGRTYLSRNECRNLSNWLRKQALTAWA